MYNIIICIKLVVTNKFNNNDEVHTNNVILIVIYNLL